MGGVRILCGGRRNISSRGNPARRHGPRPTGATRHSSFCIVGLRRSLLDQCLEAVRSQGPRPAEASSGLVTLAELLFEATKLGRWTILHGSAAELQGRCNLTPARISALTVLLGRPRVRIWRLPPCVTAGQAGQHIELRFNSIPPPPGYLKRQSVRRCSRMRCWASWRGWLRRCGRTQDSDSTYALSARASAWREISLPSSRSH